MTNEEIKEYSPYWVITYYGWSDGWGGSVRQYYTTYKDPVMLDKSTVVKWWNENKVYAGSMCEDTIEKIGEDNVQSDPVRWWEE